MAPELTVPLPEGSNAPPGAGDVALTSTGPDGLSVRVTITPTDLDPGGAFLRYGADMRTAKPGVRDTVAGGAVLRLQQPVAQRHRRWGRVRRPHDPHLDEHQGFLVAIHLQGPASAPGFGTAKTTLMQQFAVVIP